MQDRYVGDIGDFGKYSLLNFIQRETGLKLGVNWYLTDPNKLGEKKKKDGNITGYENIKHLDEVLYNKLQKLVHDKTRSVTEVEESGILPDDTVFFSEEVEVKNRKEWFERAIVQLKDCEIVFMDPDNGIGNDPRSAKHVLFTEVQSHIDSGQSTILYRHCDRHPTKHAWQIKSWMMKFERLRCMIGVSLPAIRFHRKSARDYIFISQSEHHRLVLSAINKFLQTQWGQKEKGFDSKHFDRTPDWFHW